MKFDLYLKGVNVSEVGINNNGIYCRDRGQGTIVSQDWEKLFKTNPDKLQKDLKTYVYKESILPREFVSRFNKRVIKKESAEIFVIPTDLSIYIRTCYTCYVFVNESNHVLLVSSYDFEYSVGDKLSKFTTKDKTDLDLDSYTCIYIGSCDLFDKPEFIDELYDGLFDNKVIVHENEFIKWVHENTTEEDTLETLRAIRDLLKSLDNETVKLGFKTLASINYTQYPISAKFITINSNHTNCGNSVTIMMRILNNLGSTYNKNITSKDWELLLELIKDTGKMGYLLNFEFIKITKDLKLIPTIKDE